METGATTAASSKAWLDAIAEVANGADVGTERFLDDLTEAFSDNRVDRLLPPSAADAARALAAELSRLTRTGGEPACPRSMFQGVSGAILLAWAESAGPRSDVVIAGLLELGLRAHQAPSRLIRAARARVLHGPLIDALRCLPLAGDPEWVLDDPKARARFELLVWEAGASALALPGLGAWLFAGGSFDRLVLEPCHGNLRRRVVAARLLALAADGFPSEEVDAARGIHTARITRDLAHHPEPMVWIPAALAMGRLSAKSRDVRALLFRWLDGDNVGERRRAVTALAAMPGAESWWLESRLSDLFRDDADPWTLAALGPAIPYLACERRDLWVDLARRILNGSVGPETLWSFTQGLLTLERRGNADRTTRGLIEAARQRALESDARSATEAQLFDDIRRHTDYLDGIDPDPTDLDLLLQRSVTSAVRVGADKVAPRVVALMRSLRPTFEAAISRIEQNDDAGSEAQSLAAAESCARAMALALWEPILEAADQPQTSRDDVSALAARTAALLRGTRPEFAKHRTALRMLGSLADAASTPDERGEMAAFISQALAGPSWVRHLEKREASRFQKPLGDLLWRIMDGAKEPDRPAPSSALFARFAAWWAVAAPAVDLLDYLSRTEPAARSRVTQQILESVASIRAHFEADDASLGGWTGAVHGALEDLHAGETALATAVTSFGVALAQLERARHVRGPTASTVALLTLGEAAAELAPMLSNPRGALLPGGNAPLDQRVRDLAAEGVRSLEESILEADEAAVAAFPWREALGPVLGPLAERAVTDLIDARHRHRPSTRPPRRRIGAYRLERRLGGGSQGDVWRVENDRNGRRFVMKLLASGGVTHRGEEERNALKVALQMEADILKQIYHPNVANFVDSGWDRDQPYLVMEYLVGCDLDAYAAARELDLGEAKPIIRDVASGLSALQRFGLVHCDLKPGNIFLRLALPDEADEFAPAAHRDPETAPILGAVVIDFGVSRTMAVVADESADTVSGTLGYLAPEQADGAVHPKTDVYALAATVFRILTGRPFFAHLDGAARRLIAHHKTAPMTDPAHRALLAKQPRLVTLLDEATALDPDARPMVDEFAGRFLEL